MVQNAVADPTLREGQEVRGPWPSEKISRIAEGALAFGHLVKFGTAPEEQCIELPTLPVADVDAIATAAVIGSAVTAQQIGAAAFDGVIGRDRIIPCRTLTITFDASVDWNTPSGECRVDFYGQDAGGNKVKLDTVAKPNGSGAGTYQTKVPAMMCTEIDIERCNGAGGTATVGVDNNRVALSQVDYPGVALFESMKEPNTAAREVAQFDDVNILTRGTVAVVVEHAVSNGDKAYVRVLAAGADITGQFTGQDGADTPATYAELVGARYRSSAVADAVAILELTGV